MIRYALLFWVLHGGNVTEPQMIEGFRTEQECLVAAESLTESNPREETTHRFAVIARCVVVPR